MTLRPYLLLILCTVTFAPACDQTKSSAGNPLTRSEQDRQHFEAVVVERHPSGPYAYHALRSDDGAVAWLVTIGKGEPVGTAVVARSFARRDNFHSRRLDRTFDSVLFGIVNKQD